MTQGSTTLIMASDITLPPKWRWVANGKNPTAYIMNQYDQCVCQICFTPITQQNTKCTRRLKEKCCGQCYLKWKALERERMGLS